MCLVIGNLYILIQNVKIGWMSRFGRRFLIGRICNGVGLDIVGTELEDREC